MIRVIIAGALGKMGKTLLEAIHARPDEFEAVAGYDAYASSYAHDMGIPIYSSLNDIKEEADMVIDFSRPEALEPLLSYCADKRLILITGTTGFSDAERVLLDKYALQVPIFASSNLSIGVNLQLQLVKRAASTLGEKFETEILEKHHHFKVDAPSGTALMLADAISSQFPGGRKYTYGRYTKTERRRPDELGIHSVRGGTLVGEHEVYFIGEDEIVEINHKAYSKRIYAQGALRAAEFMMGKQPGIYDMQDIVLENDVMSHLYAEDEQAIIRMSDIAGVTDIYRAFSSLADKGVFVDMISMAAPSAMSFTVPMNQRFTACAELEGIFPKSHITAIPNITKVVVEGVGMEFRHGIAAQIFEALLSANINILMISTSETKVSCAIDSENASRALDSLADAFDL